MIERFKNYLVHKFELGIVINKNQVIAHRSVLKIFINPFLRYLLGIQIASVIDEKTYRFKKYVLVKCNYSMRKFKFHLELDSVYTSVIRDRCFI